MAAARALARIVVLLLLFLTLVPLPLTHAQPKPGGELALVSTEEPDTLDPQKTGTAVTGLLMRYLGDTLLTKDLKGSFIPALARSWSVSGDGLTWTFQLRNDVKFHAGPPFVDRVVLRIMPESAAQVAAFERGELSVLALPPTDVRRLQGTNKYTIYSFLRKGVGLFMEFNVTKEPFSDIRVRRAVSHAIEKNSVLQIGLEGLGEVASGPLPPSIWGYWDGIKEYAPKYDPGKAKALLAEAGWRPGPDGMLQKDGKPFSFTLYTAPIDTWTRSAQIVQSQLRAFGISMEIQTFEFGTLLAKLKAGEHPAEFMGYTYTSPDIVQLWFHSSNIGTGLAFSHNKDSKLDSLIEASRRATPSQSCWESLPPHRTSRGSGRSWASIDPSSSSTSNSWGGLCAGTSVVPSAAAVPSKKRLPSACLLPWCSRSPRRSLRCVPVSQPA